MYRDYNWRAGKLYTRSTPDGPWTEATMQETICWLVERVQQLELTQVEVVKALGVTRADDRMPDGTAWLGRG